MPDWLQAVSKINPLTCEVEALRALLVGTSTILWLDFVVLAGATLAGITRRRCCSPGSRGSKESLGNGSPGRGKQSEPDKNKG